MKLQGYDKRFFYKTLENLHLIKNKLVKNVEKDLKTYVETYGILTNDASSVWFSSMLGLFYDLNIFELNDLSYRLIQDTLIQDFPTNAPELFNKCFYISTPKFYLDYDNILFSVHGNGQFLCQIFDSSCKYAVICIQGFVKDIYKLATYTMTGIGDHGNALVPDATEAKTAVFRFLTTFALLLQADKSPYIIEGAPRKLQNHYAKKHNVSKYLWTTNHVFLNAKIKRIYESDHTPMDMNGRTATPSITKAHIRQYVDKNGYERPIFVCSYLSTKYKKDTLIKNKIGVYNV